MNLLKKTMSLLSVVMSGMLIISAVPQAQSNLSLSASAATTCVVNTSKTYQKIKGFGGMNLPEWAGSDLTDTQRKLAFGNGNGQLGLSIVRVYVNDDKNQWNKALATAKYAQSQGAIVFATPWNPPASMCERFSKSNDPDAKRLKKSSYAAYAQHLNDFYHYMKNNGVNLYAISIQNEPDWGSDWTWMTESECVDFLANYADKIDCPVMSPESFSYNKSYYNAILNNSKAYANTDIFGTHFYGTSRSNMDFPALENCGKEIFMTEVYVPNSTSDADKFPEALDVCENIHNGLVVGNMNAYVWWYIRRSYGLIKENSNVSKRGYCLAQYSKFVRPGDVRVDATEQPSSKVYVSAYKNSKNQVTIVAVNKSTTGYSQNFSLSSGRITDVDRYRTSSNENLALTENLPSNGSSFNVQLPASSVSTFVVTVNGSSQPTTQPATTKSANQTTAKSTTTKPVTQTTTKPSANSSYLFRNTFENGVEDWTARGSNTLGLSGRTAFAGKNALLVSKKTSSWNGAQKSLSTSTFVPGNTYGFSAYVNYLDGNTNSSTFNLTLQYKDSTGTTKYSNIVTKSVTKGTYTKLVNSNYKIPSGASDIHLIVETSKDTMNFYVDEVIGAKSGQL
ncbi:MAG: carbohydrate binding domain-containing protein [Ruminococcus sp.]|jgi:glucuronoarabinoxylan endo-1,4-beta-xylanase|nr:carbohydrate binding domain-containing protein [Ruminococcus sp.]